MPVECTYNSASWADELLLSDTKTAAAAVEYVSERSTAVGTDIYVTWSNTVAAAELSARGVLACQSRVRRPPPEKISKIAKADPDAAL